LYEAYLGGNGYQVLTSAQGAHAIRLAQDHPLKAAVVDYEMPEMNGHHATLELKRIRPALPVILVSGSEDIPPETLQVVDFFVPKGAGPSRLGEIIGTLVRG
jgi:CheY-like chemotaxis protein